MPMHALREFECMYCVVQKLNYPRGRCLQNLYVPGWLSAIWCAIKAAHMQRHGAMGPISKK